MEYCLGIDIGGTKIAYGLFDKEKKMVKKYRIPSDNKADAYHFFKKISEIIMEYQNEVTLSGGKLIGVGIGVPGFVDFEKGSVTRIPSLPNLKDFAIKDFMKKELGDSIKIAIDNDGHCGALAEFRQGAGRGLNNMLYCPISTGISTGMILNGELFRGSNGAAGESGHMLSCISKMEQMSCMCGNNGCFNSLCSGKAIVSYVKHWILNGNSTIITDMVSNLDQITAKEINEAYLRGDELATKAIKQMVHYLAIWVFNIYMLLNVDTIVFAGGLLKMGDVFFDEIVNEFERYHKNGFDVHLIKSALEQDSGLIGAMELLY